MATIQYRSVQAQAFPGLTTVGYQFFNPDGTANGSRLTAGITERGTGTGDYGGNVTFPSNFSGEIRWDSGDSPLSFTVSEDVNLIAEGAPAPVFGDLGTVPWSFIVTKPDATTPLEFASVIVSLSTDITQGSPAHYTDVLGKADFMLDFGTWYAWVFCRGYNFPNPYTVVVV